GRDIGSVEQVAEIAGDLGVDRQALLDAVGDQRIKDRLREQTQAAIERGVFGSPFVFVDGEPFWGADRLDQVERQLAAGSW
ncbi:MAG: DsbA family protein, partial [Geminicoccaceae bacterium]